MFARAFRCLQEFPRLAIDRLCLAICRAAVRSHRHKLDLAIRREAQAAASYQAERERTWEARLAADQYQIKTLERDIFDRDFRIRSLESALKISEQELAGAAGIIARDRARVDAETATFARRSAAAQHGASGLGVNEFPDGVVG